MSTFFIGNRIPARYADAQITDESPPLFRLWLREPKDTGIIVSDSQGLYHVAGLVNGLLRRGVNTRVPAVGWLTPKDLLQVEEWCYYDVTDFYALVLPNVDFTDWKVRRAVEQAVNARWDEALPTFIGTRSLEDSALLSEKVLSGDLDLWESQSAGR